MSTVREMEKDEELVLLARERLIAVLEAHHGCFPSTSEEVRCLGLRTSYACRARKQLKAEGLVITRKFSLPGMTELDVDILTYMEPSPEMLRATYLAHLASMNRNAYGKDSHPWRNETLACPICAMLRTVHAADWGPIARNGRGHRRTHEANPALQLSLGRGQRSAAHA